MSGTTTPTNDLCEVLREAVRKDGRTLRQLADDAGFDVGMLSRFVRGERHLRSDAVAKLATALGLELRKVRRRKEGR